MNKICKILSAVFSPLLVPTYAVIIALWTSMLSFNPLAVRLRITLICFAITCLAPVVAILALYKMKLISNPVLNERKERTWPYLATIVCYAACAWMLESVKAPAWLWLFMIGGAAAAAVSLIVNRWWKISAHLAAMGGLMAVVFRMAQLHVVAPGIDFLAIVAAVVIVTGAVATARVYLGCHSLTQVIAGAANGFLCVYIITGF